eukprot:scaffold225_cov235-Pinguiococcus_pyrenoidosus.AAC.12
MDHRHQNAPAGIDSAPCDGWTRGGTNSSLCFIPSRPLSPREWDDSAAMDVESRDIATLGDPLMQEPKGMMNDVGRYQHPFAEWYAGEFKFRHVFVSDSTGIQNSALRLLGMLFDLVSPNTYACHRECLSSSPIHPCRKPALLENASRRHPDLSLRRGLPVHQQRVQRIHQERSGAQKWGAGEDGFIGTSFAFIYGLYGTMADDPRGVFPPTWSNLKEEGASTFWCFMYVVFNLSQVRTQNRRLHTLHSLLPCSSDYSLGPWKVRTDHRNGT